MNIENSGHVPAAGSQHPADHCRLAFPQLRPAKMVRIPGGEPELREYPSVLDVRHRRLIELIGGALVAVGLFTRYAAFLMSGEMAVAYWIFANRPARGFTPIANGGTLEVLFCFVFLYLVFAGAGPWSLDALLRKKT